MPTILIVDDQPSVLAALAYVFTSSRYATALAASGTEAWAIVESQLIDVALVDLHMPVVDGLAVTRGLVERARNQQRALPIWMMTAAYTNDAAAKCVEAGARLLLKKPFDTEELLREIAACLESGNSPPSDQTPVEVRDTRAVA